MLMLVLTQVFSCFGKHLICNFHDDFFVKIVDYFSLYRIKHPSNRPLKGAVLLWLEEKGARSKGRKKALKKQEQTSSS